MAAMLHDLYAYKIGSYGYHAHKGAALAREILNELELTDEAEAEIICSAIYHHDIKIHKLFDSRIYLITEKSDPLAQKSVIEMDDLKDRTLMVSYICQYRQSSMSYRIESCRFNNEYYKV